MEITHFLEIKRNTKKSVLIKATSNTSLKYMNYCTFSKTEKDVVLNIKNIQLFDLTKMFGAGNEPAIEEFETMFLEDYYPYDVGTLKSMFVNEINVKGVSDDIYNYVDF